MPTVLESLQIAQQALARGDRAGAQYIYEQILAALPSEPNALSNLGLLAFQAGQWEAAGEYLRRAIAVVPGEPSLHNNLNLVYRRLGRLPEAVACCRAAIAINPALPELHNNLAIALKASGALEESLASFAEARRLRPDYADAWYNEANALVQLRRLADAEVAYRRATELAPQEFEAHNNLGTLLQLQGRFAEAGTCYDQALVCRPDSAEAHRNRAMLRLLLGDYRQGWPEYEWRWRMPDVELPTFHEPRWSGEPLAGKTILLWPEQGIGDLVQCLRFAPEVQAQGARVLLECSPRLHAFLSTAPGIDQLLSTGEPRPTFDFHFPLMSLPAALGTELETLPRPPYLFAEHQRVARWQAQWAEKREFKVGIAWQGNPDFPGDYYRSIPLAAYAPLAACPGVQLYSLQKNFGREQLAAWTGPAPITDLWTMLDEGGHEFVEVAAVMKNLDLVITSDTSIAHVAGALGVPVWVALQQTANWRWLADRADCPWYPTMRLFRQTRLREWDDVFAAIATELASLLQAGTKN